MASPFISVILGGGEGMIHFFHRSYAKKPESGHFFWLDRKQYGWTALFRLAKTLPSVSLLLSEQVRRLSFLEFEEYLNRNFIHWNFPFHRTLKITVKNSTINWTQFQDTRGYKLQKRQTVHFSNNQFMNGIAVLNWFDCNSSFRNRRIFLSDLRFHNTFQFVKYSASA